MAVLPLIRCRGSFPEVLHWIWHCVQLRACADAGNQQQPKIAEDHHLLVGLLANVLTIAMHMLKTRLLEVPKQI